MTYETNANSQLISEKIKGAFFPFKVKDILDIILEEYDDGHRLELEFQGTSDEFVELENLVAQFDYPIDLSQSPLFLANARDILPQVVAIFERTRTLLPEELMTDPSVKQFLEASNDRVPLLVLGNYSAGKSTLINALLGQELLPNSDSPATAKLVEISRVPLGQPARLRLGYDGQEFQLEVTETDGMAPASSDLLEALPILEPLVTDCQKQSAVKMFQQVLEVINHLPAEQGALIADLVQIELPLDQEQQVPNLVIFDTPGSNSSSNTTHFEVLQEALTGMSNGLLLFVTDYTSLDTVDNHKLYEELQGIEALDTRFTLLVVNKADQADLSDFDEQAVLQQALPKQLYSEGIYFVSSIMGLGHKLCGQFEDKNYERIFRKSLEEFTRPDSPYYQKLYTYNILPPQLKERRCQEAKELHQDRLYANSGFLSLEQELVTFANTYSPYNKCQQARRYLDELIQKTSQQISNLKLELESDLVLLTNQLEGQKRDLITRTSERYANDWLASSQAYKEHLANHLKTLPKGLDLLDLEERCETYYQEVKGELGLEEQDKQRLDRQHLFMSQVKGLGSQVKLAIQKRDIGVLSDQVEQLQDNVKGTIEERKAYESLKNQAFSQVSALLKQFAQTDYDRQLGHSTQVLFDQSVAFWADHCRALKQTLAQQIGLADELPLDRREALRQLIFDHEAIVWHKKAEDLFEKARLEQGIHFGEKVLFGNSNKIDLPKMVRHYDRDLTAARREVEDRLRQNHQAIADVWSRELMDLIERDIVAFNPNLRKTHESILSQTARIKTYQEQLEQLTACSQEMAALLSFKTTDEEKEDGH